MRAFAHLSLAAHLVIQGVIEPGGFEPFEQLVGGGHVHGAAADSSQVSRRMLGSSPEARARNEADLASRRVTSSARTNSRKSAWVICCGRARV